MTGIVCADNNWGIGLDGSLLVRIPQDMKRFRALTWDRVVVLGRKTLETFPNGLPLEGRVNIVLTSRPDFHAKDAVIVHDLDELREVLKDYPPEDVFCIGGGTVYAQLLDDCDKVLVTRLERALHADAFFPALDKDKHWKLESESEEQTYFDTVYTFQDWVRV